jgi:hypothetical protein
MSNLHRRLTYDDIVDGRKARERRQFWITFTILAAFGVSVVLLGLAVWGKL